MAVRVTRGRRYGNSADAGRLCVTPTSPDGVKPSTYTRMITQMGAPGPVGFNPDNGDREYDLDAVEKWNRERPGPGVRHPDRRTQIRHQTLRAVAERRMQVVIRDMHVQPLLDGQPFEGRVNARVFSDLRSFGLILVPEKGGDVRLSSKGRATLGSWNLDEVASREANARVVGAAG